MEDRLEKFIKENRADFDDATPNLKVWAALDKELHGPKQKVKTKPAFAIRRWASIAAAAVLLLGVGTLMGIQMTKSQYSDLGEMAALMEDFSEMEDRYQSEITKKVSLLDNHKIEKSVKTDLTQLESFLSELKVELEEAPKESKEKIVSAMITNYQTRLEILERILNKIEASGSQNNKDENIEI